MRGDGDVSKRTRAFTAALMLIIVLLTVGCDQASKAVARSSLGDGRLVSFLGGLLVMRYVENQGAFLSLGAWLPRPIRRALFIVFPLAMLAVMIGYVARKREIRSSFVAGISLVCGGGLGNLMDRILHDGRVGDFLNLGVGGLRTGIFNLADLSIIAGCVLLLLGDRRPEHPDGASGNTGGAGSPAAGT